MTDRGQRALAEARAICEELVHIGEENQSDIFASPEVIRLGILQPIITAQAELERLQRIEAAVRDYLAHDGSGIKQPEPWSGDYDAIKHGETLRALRAALATDGAET